MQVPMPTDPERRVLAVRAERVPIRAGGWWLCYWLLWYGRDESTTERAVPQDLSAWWRVFLLWEVTANGSKPHNGEGRSLGRSSDLLCCH